MCWSPLDAVADAVVSVLQLILGVGLGLTPGSRGPERPIEPGRASATSIGRGFEVEGRLYV